MTARSATDTAGQAAPGLTRRPHGATGTRATRVIGVLVLLGAPLVLLTGGEPMLQREIVAAGYPLRIAAPYGPTWFTYLMRRLAERPANLGFLARNLVRR